MSHSLPQAPLPMRLAALIRAVQRRWGQRALQQGAPAIHDWQTFSTGYAALDALTGGIPRGTVTELLGAPTSGAATLAYGILAEAQRRNVRVALLDLPHALDAAYLAACNVDLHRLLVVQPPDARAAIDLLGALLGERGVDLVLVDDLALLQAQPQGAVLLDQALRRLGPLLTGSGAALLVRTPLPYPASMLPSVGMRGSLLGQAAALRIHLDGSTWRLDCPACPERQVRATLLHRRGSPPGGTASLTVSFPVGRGAR